MYRQTQTEREREREREREIMSGGGDEDVVFLFCFWWRGGSYPISNVRFGGKWVFGFCRREMEVVDLRLTK